MCKSHKIKIYYYIPNDEFLDFLPYANETQYTYIYLNNIQGAKKVLGLF